MILNPEFNESNIRICTYPVTPWNSEVFEKIKAGIADNYCALTYSSTVAPLDTNNNLLALSCGTHVGYLNLAIKRGTYDQIYSFDVNTVNFSITPAARRFQEQEQHQDEQYSLHVFRYTNEDNAKLETLLDSTVSKEMKLEVMNKHYSALFTYDGLNTDPDSHEIVSVVALSKIQSGLLLNSNKKSAKSFGLIYVEHPTYKIIPTYKFSVNKSWKEVKYDTTIITLEENERFYFLFQEIPSEFRISDVWHKDKLKEYKVYGDIKLPSKSMLRVHHNVEYPSSQQFLNTAVKERAVNASDVGSFQQLSNAYFIISRKLSSQPGESHDYKFSYGKLCMETSSCDANVKRLMFKNLTINKCVINLRSHGQDVIVQEEKEPLRLCAKTLAQMAKRNEKCSQLLHDSPNDKFGNVYQSIVGHHAEVMRLIDIMDARRKFVEAKYKKTSPPSEEIECPSIVRHYGIINAKENPIVSKYSDRKQISNMELMNF